MKALGNPNIRIIPFLQNIPFYNNHPPPSSPPPVYYNWKKGKILKKEILPRFDLNSQIAMKFGKSLGIQIEETLPEWRDKFLSYKELKKRLKLLGGEGSPPAKKAKVVGDYGGGGEAGITREEEEFLKLLEDELEKFNAFFMEKEEEYIIRQKELLDQVERVVAKGSKEELMRVRKEIVDFHGEMVLLENYSVLNYTGLVKILKKYDKRTGALIRLPFIQKVLQQPFFTTDMLNILVNECGAMLDRLVAKVEPSLSSEDDREVIDGVKTASKLLPSSILVRGDVADLEEIEFMENLYMKSTVSALRVLKEIRSGSSTVSVFSLPPLQRNKAPVLEQLAK